MARPSSKSLTANAIITPDNVEQMIANPSNWKPTKKNNYSIYCTIVEPGITFKNKFELCEYQTTPEQQVILSGTRGEQWLTTLDQLAKNYYFTGSIKPNAPKRPIDPNNPKSASIDVSQLITTASIKARTKNKSTLPWTSITTIPTGGGWTHFCFHLPMSVKNFKISHYIANADGVKHGSGDFLLCAITPDGKPDLDHICVINGEVFLDTYNKSNIRGLNSNNIITVAQKPDKEYVVVPQKANLDTVISSKEKAKSVRKAMYSIIAKVSTGKKVIEYFAIEQEVTKEVKIIDRSALLCLVGSGQIKGVTVQLRVEENKIGLLAKEGFSLKDIPTKSIKEFVIQG